MGICPSLSPEARVINKKNQVLIELFRNNLSELHLYGFTQHVLQTINQIQPRYLYTQGILQDIQRILTISNQSTMKRSSYGSQMNFQQQIRNSCLILQNQQLSPLLNSNQQPLSPSVNDSFKNNLMKNQSLVVQINILYSKQLKKGDYSDALYLFLKWAQIFQEHSYGGFLKPIYKQFCKYIYTIPRQDFSTIVDEMSIFVQFLVAIVTHIYNLNTIVTTQHGKLIKNQNVYNLIMSYLFKKTSLKHFIVNCIKKNEQVKIKLFQKQILHYNKSNTQFFGISRKFRLNQSQMTQSEINKSLQIKEYIPPYAKSLKFVNQLCGSGSPVTKLKTIVHISKEIINQIHGYYQNKQQQSPDLDPDNLSSIVMYLIVKNGNPSIYQQLKIVQHFTTTNCLTCISGFYLNVFIAAIQSILELQSQ